MKMFENAKTLGLSSLGRQNGVGTLSEKSLHAVLKFWVDDDETHHEIKIGVGRVIVDVFDGEKITEIQTTSLNAVKKKLERLLPLYPLNLVYPVLHERHIYWIDPSTGESSDGRKSPKTGRIWDAFKELIYIRDYVLHENFSLNIVFVDVDEYKLLNGWDKHKKRGSSRVERVPKAVVHSMTFEKIEDFIRLIPSDMEELFTAEEFRKKISVSKALAQRIIYFLRYTGAIIHTGKKGKAFLYKMAEQTE